MQNAPSDRLDYLVIGHITRDITTDGRRVLGGTASYAARTAQMLKKRVGVITSAESESGWAALSDVEILRIPAAATTTFKNQYGPSGREQAVLSVASTLSPREVPNGWRETAVAHIGPVAQECDPALVRLFPTSFVGVTPQGWMRRWDDQGRVHRTAWEHAQAVLPHADAVVLSEEDIVGREDLIPFWAGMTPILVVTRGENGCTVYTGGATHDIPGLRVETLDPTGAGDIFAAALFVLLESGLQPVAAAHRANCIAAHSVTRAGLSGIPTSPEINRCLDR
jgi:sugar/nucleoside kinase (ribokinase family)